MVVGLLIGNLFYTTRVLYIKLRYTIVWDERLLKYVYLKQTYFRQVLNLSLSPQRRNPLHHQHHHHHRLHHRLPKASTSMEMLVGSQKK